MFDITNNKSLDLRLAINDLREEIGKIALVTTEDAEKAKQLLFNLINSSQPIAEKYLCYNESHHIINDLSSKKILNIIKVTNTESTFSFFESDINFSSDGNFIYATNKNGNDFFHYKHIEENIISFKYKLDFFKLLNELEILGMPLWLSDVSQSNKTTGLEFID